jgi:hypothetical protein
VNWCAGDSQHVAGWRLSPRRDQRNCDLRQDGEHGWGVRHEKTVLRDLPDVFDHAGVQNLWSLLPFKKTRETTGARTVATFAKGKTVSYGFTYLAHCAICIGHVYWLDI